jgi:acyl-coenzyme A synthetase/AMP-(fatty) acid ligase
MPFQPLDVLTSAAIELPEGLFYADSDQSLTFVEAYGLSAQFAGELRRLGVSPGDSVAIDLPAGMQVLFSFAAFHLAAASATASVPTAPSEIEWDWWVTSSDQPPGNARNVIIVDNAFLIRAAGLPTVLAPTPYPSDNSVCRFSFTSGTTGRPKAVALTVSMVEHRSLDAGRLFERDAPFLCTLGLSTTSGFHTLVACTRAQLPYLAPGDGLRNRDTILRHGVAALKGSPQQISDIIGVSTGGDVKSIRTLYSAGGKLSQSLIDGVRRVSDAKIVNLFGSSEAGRASETEISEKVDPDFAGVVVSQTVVEVIDDLGNPLANGETGVIRYRAPHMAVGYVGDSTATADAFRDGWFYPGDVGRLLDDGSLFLEGRVADTLNAGGVKIDPTAFEEFAATLSGVSEAIGFVHDNERGVPQFVLAIAGTGINVLNVSRELETKFGQSRPSGIFSLPAIPRTESGKVSRRLTAELYSESIGRAKH